MDLTSIVITSYSIHYTKLYDPQILVAMSQAGYDKFAPALLPESGVLVDQDLVNPENTVCDSFAIPATRMAENLGNKMMANIIMLGFCTVV